MYDDGIIMRFFVALALTWTVEVATLLVIAKKWYVKPFAGIETSRIIGAGFLTSFALLPYLWFVLPYFFDDRLPYAIAGELFVVFVEGLIYILTLKLDVKAAFIVSLCCNAVSWSLGEVFNYFYYS